jgi:hypothetical protein
MTLLEWGALGELIGGVAIIGSLIYVGVQVKDSAKATRSAAANDATVSMQTWYLEMGSNRQTSELWLNAMRSPEPLSTHDEFQFLMLMHAVFLGFQNSYLLSQEGTLDPEIRKALTFAIIAVKDLPGMGRYWRQRRGFLHSGFANYVDGLLLRDSIETLDAYKRTENGPDK